jgi:hypothetical protein
VEVVLSAFTAGKDPEDAIIKPGVSGSQRILNRVITCNKRVI